MPQTHDLTVKCHGGSLYFDGAVVEFKPRSPLKKASITDVRQWLDELHAGMSDSLRVESDLPTARDGGHVALRAGDQYLSWDFSPNQEHDARAFAAALTRLCPSTTIPGLNFVALDVETANSNYGSVCQIGVVRIVDGAVADSSSWLCMPPEKVNYFDEVNVGIHGITPEAVADAAPFSEVIDEVRTFIGADSVVAHFAQFDTAALREACLYEDVAPLEFSFGCSYVLSTMTDLGQQRNGLKFVAEAVGYDLVNHHDALADAEACAAIIVEVARREDLLHPFDNTNGTTVADMFHRRGVLLGTSASSIQPVLTDRNGTGVVLQRRSLSLSPLPEGARLARTRAPRSRRQHTSSPTSASSSDDSYDPGWGEGPIARRRELIGENPRWAKGAITQQAEFCATHPLQKT